MYLRKKDVLPPIISALALVVIFAVKHKAERFLSVLKINLGWFQNPSPVA